jgi:hypothetical protein
MEVSYEAAYKKACAVIGDLTVRLQLTEEQLEAAQALLAELMPDGEQEAPGRPEVS